MRASLSGLVPRGVPVKTLQPMCLSLRDPAREIEILDRDALRLILQPITRLGDRPRLRRWSSEPRGPPGEG